jgi:hypothetical protein
VNYGDAIVARLADPQTRAGIFDEQALGRVLAAAYSDDDLHPQPPFAAVFDELRLGVATSQSALLTGSWSSPGAAERTEAWFSRSGIGGDRVGADALWRGSIRATVPPPAETIPDVDATWAEPDSGALTVTFSPPSAAPASARTIPIVAAITVRGLEEFSLRALLQQAKTARELLVRDGFATAPAGDLPARGPLTLIWIVAPALFDDEGWPGADSAARLASAATWPEGIALLTVPEL